MKAFAKFGEVYGIDISPEAISFCRKRKLSHVRLGFANATKFPASSFDIVTMLDVLEHVNDKMALKEVKRILRPGGVLILTVPAYKLLWSKWDVALAHKRRYEKKALTKLLQNLRFEVIKCSYLYSFLFLPVFLIRSIKSKTNKGEYTSDFTLNPGLINWFLLKIARLEQQIVMYWQVPFGTSIICVARVK